MDRVAVLDRDMCRPDDCGRLCYRVCPEVRMKVFAITFEEGEKKPTIVENLCTGCGICIKKCPFDAIEIVNLPGELADECSHRYGKNAFKLFRLPIPTLGMVTGLVGKNGTGKTTALKILAGEAKPNLGRFDEPPEWSEVIRTYRGSELQNFFSAMSQQQVKVIHKPQYIDKIPHILKGTVREIIQHADERNCAERLIDLLELREVLEREAPQLSGGEGQRLAIAAAVCREGDLYIFDEPSSYLDVRQRLNAAKAIRSIAEDGKTVIVAEHDIAMLDYLSDQVCIVYGNPGVYGIVSKPHGVRTGINIYLDGYLPDDNMRFREQPIRFHTKPPGESWTSSDIIFQWADLGKHYDGFQLKVEAGEIWRGEVLGILGPNGIGKTTFVKILAGYEKPSEGEVFNPEGVILSYKPQYISANYPGTVEELLKEIAKENFHTSYYKSEILLPLGLDKLGERRLPELSGGELQKVTIAVCLSRSAQLYLIDEPSAFLDVEERLAVARIIRRIVENAGAGAIVVEHDVVVQDFIADKLMPFSGRQGVSGYAHRPMGLRSGMNTVLSDMGMTFRRDASSGRPRVNKEGSKLDRYQKEIGEYYYVPNAKVEQAE